MEKYNSIIILGPTGSGKTELSIKLAKALNGDIINADSMQIYKYFNIGTAKPSIEERAGIVHHLMDFLEPTENFSVSEYRKLCLETCETLINNKKTPIIVGGTGFYIDSLLNNYSYGNSEKDEKIRKKYLDLYDKFGKEHIYNILKTIDIETADKLHPNDVKRIIRALEIYETTQISKSIANSQDENNKQNNLLKPLIIGLNYERAELYDRINNRVDIMLKNGLLNEVEFLYNKYDKSFQAMKAIGYKEFFPYFNGEVNLETAIDKIKQNSRNYAKRQITWFKRNKNINWFNKSYITTDEIFDEVISKYKK